ncbi:DUF3413 domain-containing protein [Pseudoalteromonas sp. MMG013]|uniref:DUF3413 domain-containing protein n=1 Tax=Pseudoalteromonas sp. MMG013 TaxID=2822687 RepID=UPI001B380920|nr:DUF3413 domain-containing protein [Pseudoalteromonas sp. MMG013]MBQ4862916.1 DUF3413 domain-containing protein [Pseudoalteromonas sp. MMG013]
MNLSPQNPFSSKASQLLSWGHWFTFANIGLVLLISSSYLFADKSPTTLLGWFYMLITWVSHTSFITFSAFVLTIFPLSMVFPYPRHIRGMAAILATLGIALLSLDAFVYYKLGYHLNFSSLSDIVSVLWKTIIGHPIIATVAAGGFILIIFALELVAGNHAWHNLAKLKQYRFPRYATGALVSCFAMSHTIHIWADANTYFDITKQDNVLPLSYPTTAKKLLARHDLLDIEKYQQATDIQFDHNDSQYQLPRALPNCQPRKASVNIVYFQTHAELLSFTNDHDELVAVSQLIQPTNHDDARFNLTFGLPAYYRNPQTQHAHPSWDPSKRLIFPKHLDDTAAEEGGNASLIIINGSESAVKFDPKHLYFAFALAAQNSDVISTSSYFTNVTKLQQIDGFKQLQDITYTLLASHLECSELAKATMIGRDLINSRTSVGVNFTQGVLVAFKKDRITLIKHDGSYEHISGTDGFAIEQKLNVPFLIQSIKTLKQFSNPPPT